ncbi:hypothetical protein DMH18_37070 [Streptomyces sp. WAC 06783]|nr:hypothetical protein DMH18_37070 [Streptomyces sp. WAC 06783]
MKLNQMANLLADRLRLQQQYSASEGTRDQGLAFALRKLILIQAKEFMRSAEEFVFTAQAALDDDGSRK